MDQLVIDLLDTLRNQIPAKTRGAHKGKPNKITPCWRTNKAQEMKALEKAFTRHKKTTNEDKMTLVNDMILHYNEICRYRTAALKADEFLSQPRMLSVWLNQDGWQDEFETAPSEMKARVVDRTCPCCGKEGVTTTESGQWVCEKVAEKHDPWMIMLREQHKKNLAKYPRNPNEDWRDWSFRVLKGEGHHRAVKNLGLS